MASPDSFSVEVVYATADRAFTKTFRVGPSTNAGDMLALVSADPDFGDLDLDVAAAVVGIFGRVIARERLMQPGDRLEIYRALKSDPKDARRRRVQRARREGRGAPGAGSRR